MLFGDNGIITKAQEASFRQEMAEIKERVELKNVDTTLNSLNLTETDLKPITSAETQDWDINLKREVMTWGNHTDVLGISVLTNNYVKAHWESMLNKIITTEGCIPNLYLIDKETANGKENTYLYDSNTKVVYKIEKTQIGSHTVHSVEELDNEKGGGDTVSDEITNQSDFVTVGNISYYEPDLSGFSMSRTSVVYFNPDNQEDTKEISASEYFSGGKKREITEGGAIYVFHNYNKENANERLWGNIKVEGNGVIGYWVWIPRYAYSISGTTTSIIYITTDNKQADGSDLPEGYVVHSAFLEDGQTTGGKKGIWLSKYEPVQVKAQGGSLFSYYVPDLTGFDPERTYAEVYDSTNQTFKETKIKDISNVTEFANNNNWFDYKNKIWANIKVVNDEGVEGWWVWIPRYAYNITGTNTDIIFVDLDNNPLDGTDLPANYTVHPAFLEEGQTTGGLKGIWISKYEPSIIPANEGASENVNPPNLEGFNVDRTYIECYNETTQTFSEQTLRSILASNSVINNENVVTEVHIDYSKVKGIWYNYKKKIWANIKTKNSAGDVEGWWVWIPRYAYNITGNGTTIIYLSADGTPLDGESLPPDYIPHPAFDDAGSREGIWLSKYEPTGILLNLEEE